MAKKQATKSKGGRKPASDPKVQVAFWIEKSKVASVGGMEKARERCIRHINDVCETEKVQPKQDS